MTAPAILLVEDDRSLGESLSQRLAADGYHVEWLGTVAAALRAMREKPFDLAIVDIGLPDGDGFQLARELVDTQRMSFLFLTAMNDAEFRLRAFELGAVDYIPKPFHLKELLLRVQRALAITPAGARSKLAVGNLEIDVHGMALVFRDGSREQLQTRDFRILHYLVQQAPSVVSREELVKVAGSSEAHPSLRGIDNCIVRLRSLLRRGDADNIRSVRGVGYQWLSD